MEHPDSKDDHSSHIVRKWGVTGKASFSGNGRCCTITVEEWKGAACMYGRTVGHEQGHVEFFEDRLLDNPDLPFKDLMEVDTWQCEVDAWLRGLPIPFSLEAGMFALDCLWTYKVGCGVSIFEWMKAKKVLAASCADPEGLMRYTPEPVPPGESGESAPGFDFNGPEFDEDGEDLKEGGDLPDEKDMSERDKWLTSPEALPYLKQGSTPVLQRALRERGFVVEEPLPLVPHAIFAKNRGRWLW